MKGTDFVVASFSFFFFCDFWFGRGIIALICFNIFFLFGVYLFFYLLV